LHVAKLLKVRIDLAAFAKLIEDPTPALVSYLEPLLDFADFWLAAFAFSCLAFFAASAFFRLVSLAAYVLTKVSVTVYAGAIVFQTLLPETFGDPENAFWVGAFTTVILTGVYTVFGGFRAVLFTDTAQAFILIIGSGIITMIGLGKLGGWSELQAFAADNVGQYALWRPINDPDFPWLGILMASPIIGIWYWCTDQYIVQRTLAAKNLSTARRGAIFGAFLKIWPVLIFLVPGLIGAALHSKGLIELPVNSNGEIVGDQVFASMVVEMLPIGLRGLVIGGLLAALMSSLSSLFNSSASLFTYDVYQKLFPKTSPKGLVNVGRVATIVVVGLGMLWIPLMAKYAKNEGLYTYLQSVQGYLAPPITAVFLLGLFNKRVNSPGAVAGLIFGFVAGMGKLTVETMHKMKSEEVLAAEGFTLMGAISNFSFLYASGVLFVLSVAVVMGVSAMTTPPSEAQTKGLTWQALDRDTIGSSWGVGDVLATIVVLALTFGLYGYFSFWI